MKQRTATTVSLLVLMALVMSVLPAQAVAQAADSLPDSRAARWRPSPVRWVPAAAGGVMALAGGLSRRDNPSHLAAAPRAEKELWADAAQFAPLAFPWVMKACGAPTRSGWGRMAVSQAFGAGFLGATVYGIKHAVHEQRPDGTDDRSFPSGHSAWAFYGATATAIELADLSPWYAIGAYAVATGIAVERVIDKRHFPVDVIAGAGIGILSAELGYYLGDVIFGDRGLAQRTAIDDLCDAANLSFLSITSELRWPVGRISLGDARIERLPALQAGVKGGFALGDSWGLGLFVGLQSTPLRVATPLGTTHVGCQNAVGFYVAPYWQRRLTGRVTINAEAGAGYFRNLAIHSVDRAVTCGSGTVAGRVTAGIVVHLTRALSAKAHVGYELEGYRYGVSPSAAYLTTEAASAKGVRGSLVAGLSSCLNF